MPKAHFLCFYCKIRIIVLALTGVLTCVFRFFKCEFRDYSSRVGCSWAQWRIPLTPGLVEKSLDAGQSSASLQWRAELCIQSRSGQRRGFLASQSCTVRKTLSQRGGGAQNAAEWCSSCLPCERPVFICHFINKKI